MHCPRPPLSPTQKASQHPPGEARSNPAGVCIGPNGRGRDPEAGGQRSGVLPIIPKAQHASTPSATGHILQEARIDPERASGSPWVIWPSATATFPENATSLPRFRERLADDDVSS
jgi:hypothetical protein